MSHFKLLNVKLCSLVIFCVRPEWMDCVCVYSMCLIFWFLFLCCLMRAFVHSVIPTCLWSVSISVHLTSPALCHLCLKDGKRRHKRGRFVWKTIFVARVWHISDMHLNALLTNNKLFSLVPYTLHRIIVNADVTTLIFREVIWGCHSHKLLNS